MTDEKEVAEDAVIEDAEKVVDTANDAQVDSVDEESKDQQREEEKVPLSALKKERRERQESKIRVEMLEKELASVRSQAQQPIQPQVDNSNDLLTVGQQNKALLEMKRSILEEAYIENDPGIIDRMKNELPGILSNPNNKWLADSFEQAPNRLQRAKQILDMFKPSPKSEGAPAPDRTNTPRSPQSVAKTNKLSLTDRIMKMSDQELEEWRLSQKRLAR